MVDTWSTVNSESDQKETIILRNLNQFSSAPTERLFEEKPETLQEQKMLEFSRMMITDNIHFHLDYLNSSIDESEDVKILQETVEEIKEKQRKFETVLSQLIILIDPSEQSNCSREHSCLKVEVKKCINNFKKYVKRKSQINIGEDFSLSVGVASPKDLVVHRTAPIFNFLTQFNLVMISAIRNNMPSVHQHPL